jgi:hypothetical protein
MAPPTPLEALDRHALVMSIWLTTGLIATTVFHFGLGPGGAPFILAAFAVIVAAFVGHIIVNAVLGLDFTVRELALALVVYGAALIAFAGAALLSPRFAATALLPTSLGLIAVFVAFVFYRIVHSGLRPAFEAFDAIRSFRARDQRSSDAAGNARE